VPFDLVKFTTHLRAHATKDWGHARCALRMRQALEAGGAEVQPHPTAGKLFGPALERIGFHAVKIDDLAKFIFRNGDVMVMAPFTRGNPSGHVAAYDGRDWISDFIQSDFWAGPGYRKDKPSYVIYRY
jgi:hypothetical protein